MFSETEVLTLIVCVLAIYIGLSILWQRALAGMSYNDYTSFSNKFKIETADRIFSVSEDNVCNGIWCQIVVSLWRCRKTKDFYISFTYEYNKGKPLQEFRFIDKWKAKEMIQKYTPQSLAIKLIDDWVERTNRAI